MKHRKLDTKDYIDSSDNNNSLVSKLLKRILMYQ